MFRNLHRSSASCPSPNTVARSTVRQSSPPLRLPHADHTSATIHATHHQQHKPTPRVVQGRGQLTSPLSQHPSSEKRLRAVHALLAPALPAVTLPKTIIIYPFNSPPFDVLRPLRPFSQTGSTISTSSRSRARPLRIDLEGQPGRATLNFEPSRSPLADKMDTESDRDSHWREGFPARGCR